MCRTRLAQSLYEKVSKNLPLIIDTFISTLPLLSTLEEYATFWSSVVKPKIHQTIMALLYLDKVYIAARGNELRSISEIVLHSFKEKLSLQSMINPLIGVVIENPASNIIDGLFEMLADLHLLTSFTEDSLRPEMIKYLEEQARTKLEGSNIDHYLQWIKEVLLKYKNLPLKDEVLFSYFTSTIILSPIFLNPLKSGTLLRKDRMTSLIMGCCKPETESDNNAMADETESSVAYLVSLCRSTSSLAQLRETWFSWIKGVGEDVLRTKDPFDRLLSLYNHLLTTVTPSFDVNGCSGGVNIYGAGGGKTNTTTTTTNSNNNNNVKGPFFSNEEPSPDPLFIQSIKDAFDIIMNAVPEVPSRLALYCHQQIPQGSQKLPPIIRLFRHLTPASRDSFLQRLQSLLASRLVKPGLQREDLKDREGSFLLLLRKECGPAVTSRMEGMLKDVLYSLSNEDSNHSVLSVLLCTSGIWPAQPAQEDRLFKDIRVPEDVQSLLQEFEASFHSMNKGKIAKKLSFSLYQGSCILRTTFDGGKCKKELLFTIPQALVALQFGTKDQLTFDQLVLGSGFGDPIMVRSILDLFTKQGLLKKIETATWSWNDSFKNDSKRIKFIRDDYEEDYGVGVSVNECYGGDDSSSTTPVTSPTLLSIPPLKSPREGDEINHLIDVYVVSHLKKKSPNSVSLIDIMTELQGAVGDGVAVALSSVEEDQLRKRISALKEREFLREVGEDVYEYLL